MNTSKAASAAEDALKRASRTAVETYAKGISSITQRKENSKNCREKERTWGEPKKTRGFFLEKTKEEEEEGEDAECKQKKRRNMSEEAIDVVPPMADWGLGFVIGLLQFIHFHKAMGKGTQKLSNENPTLILQRSLLFCFNLVREKSIFKPSENY